VIRWVLFLLLALNLVYLAYGLHRAQTSDPYGGVPPLELGPGMRELDLLDAELDPPADPVPGPWLEERSLDPASP
jgi:hypothetical protein